MVIGYITDSTRDKGLWKADEHHLRSTRAWHLNLVTVNGKIVGKPPISKPELGYSTTASHSRCWERRRHDPVRAPRRTSFRRHVTLVHPSRRHARPAGAAATGISFHVGRYAYPPSHDNFPGAEARAPAAMCGARLTYNASVEMQGIKSVIYRKFTRSRY